MTQSPGMSDLVKELETKTPEEVADALAGKAPDDVQFVLSRLPTDQALAVVSHMAERAEDEANTTAVVSGVEAEIGELMTPAPAVIPASKTVAEAIAYLVKTTDMTEITYFFVTDNATLIGVVGMRDLLLAKPSQLLSEVMVAEPFAFHTDTPMSEAVKEALYRHYPVYPVVDDMQQVIGEVRGWKLYERIATELSAQAGSQVGVAREEQVSTPVFAAFRMRHPWLLVNLITAFAAAFVVGMFEDTITRVVALAAFLPVLAGQSGNTGCQALAITLRGMTLGQLKDFPVHRLLSKEIRLGALNGFLVGLVAGAAMYGYALMTGAVQPVMLGVVIVIAMTGACISSGVFGVLVPITLKRFGADPATASSIFLTTFTDIIGMGLMLFLATTMIL
ncbi:magnesium transporter [Pseudomaricurvus sp.]|uniref:magnesium transporter n=1 Tax=Pseudomaricurvus sp. TaxID=2004510 RepID=UPI003F6D4F93